MMCSMPPRATGTTSGSFVSHIRVAAAAGALPQALLSLLIPEPDPCILTSYYLLTLI